MHAATPVAYALDIGVYETGQDGQILSRTTAAWCRVDSGSSNFQVLRYSGNPSQGSFLAPGALKNAYTCGRSIETLAELIAKDLHAERLVALGFEAPMWLPLEYQHRPRLNLFRARFPVEQGFEWYLQSGAAATMKSIALGTMLREHIKKAASRPPQFSTAPSDTTPGGLVLFEAFVAGPYKVPGGDAARDAPNEWDALTAALAWGATHAGFMVPPTVRAVSLHGAGSRKGACMSVWSTILTDQLLGGPPDCEVVALEVIPNSVGHAHARK